MLCLSKVMCSAGENSLKQSANWLFVESSALKVVLHSHCLTTCSMSLYILENSELFKRPAMYASRQCSEATQILSQRKTYCSYEQPWVYEPDSESQQLRELRDGSTNPTQGVNKLKAYGPRSWGTKRFKRITAQSARGQATFTGIAFVLRSKTPRKARVSYGSKGELNFISSLNLKEHHRTSYIT